MKHSSVAPLAAVVLSLCHVLPAQAEPRRSFGYFGEVGRNAASWEVHIGVMSYDTGAFSPKQFDGAVLNGEVLFPSPDFLYVLGAPRPYIGFDAAFAEDGIHFVYAGLTWDTYLTDRFYVAASLGGALSSAENLLDPTSYKPLGCPTLFHLGVALGYDLSDEITVQLYADHFSNANLCDRNGGAEAAGIRAGYRF